MGILDIRAEKGVVFQSKDDLDFALWKVNLGPKGLLQELVDVVVVVDCEQGWCYEDLHRPEDGSNLNLYFVFFCFHCFCILNCLQIHLYSLHFILWELHSYI